MITKHLNGMLLKELVESGANNLANDYRRVDDLNVFPVPDGDTGTNMKMTIMAGVSELRGMLDDSIDIMAKKLSRGLLMGARGNSGVILSQLFRGIHKGLEGSLEVDAYGLLDGFRGGVEQAYRSVMNPVEGTMLTVAREATEALESKIKAGMSINEALKLYLDAAEVSLENTPNLLPKLKEAGVVDSGGVGYVLIIEGMYLALQGNPVELKSTDSYESAAAQLDVEHDEFGYCTEFIISMDQVEDVEDTLKQQLSTLGDSIVVVQDEDIIKVHVHTLTPGDALNLGQQYGEFMKLKIENMQVQHDTIVESQPSEVKNQPTKKYGVVAVAQGDGLVNMFKEFGCDQVVTGGQTMNPSTEDLVKAIQSVNADNVLVFPNNKNIILAAEQAKDLIEDQNVIVIKTTTIAQGYSALSMLELEDNPEDMEDAVLATIDDVKSGELTYAVRDTQVQGVEIQKDDYMGILDGKIVVSKPEKTEALHDLIASMCEGDVEIITLIVGEDVTEEELNDLLQHLEETHPDIEVDTLHGNQAVYHYFIAVE